MRRAAVVAAAILIALAPFAPRPVVADEVDVGGQALAITGTHTGLFGDTLHGAVPGALVEVEAHAGRAGIRLETLPVAVTVPAGGRGSFGASNIGLALFNGELTGDVIRGGALRVGIGGQIVDLRNDDGTNGERESARASGVSYVVASDVPVGRGRAIYARLSLIPNVRAQLLRFAGGAAALAPISEVGAETDASLGYEWTSPSVRYHFGIRGLNYSTRDAARGSLVDRNVGGGIFLEAQKRLGR